MRRFAAFVGAVVIISLVANAFERTVRFRAWRRAFEHDLTENSATVEARFKVAMREEFTDA